MTETIEFLGGPKNGQRLEVPRAPYDYRIPMPPGLARWAESGPELIDSPMNIGVYSPVPDEHYRASRNGSGCLVYAWRGVSRL